MAWCVNHLIRPTDEVLLCHAVDMSEDTFRALYTPPPPPPLGGDPGARGARATEAWQHASAVFAGERNLQLRASLPSEPWEALDRSLAGPRLPCPPSLRSSFNGICSQ